MARLALPVGFLDVSTRPGTACTSLCSLLVLALSWLLPAGGLATTFSLLEPAALARGSDAAFVGQVTAIESAGGTSGGIYTRVTVRVDEALKGAFPASVVTLSQPGGERGGRRLTIHGAPEFRVGERVLLFLSRAGDGRWHTSHLSMGKFAIITDPSSGRSSAVRDFGEARVLARGLRTLPSRERRPLPELLSEIRSALEREKGGGATVLPQTSARLRATAPDSPTQELERYALRDTPARWFDADVPVGFEVDPNGDVDLGPVTSAAVVEDGMDAWSSVPTATIVIENAGPATPASIFACDGESKILFNDPIAEIDPPTGCGGILALGGGCVSLETEVVNGTLFRRFTSGDVTFNDGFGPGCDFKIPCNFAEVATHEIGHAIGLGHSADPNATMSQFAAFDGRCAELAADDSAGVTFIYPGFECGDGITDPNGGETCDDGNTASCDGCSSICGVETGFLCGDGEFNPACDLECDDGNLIDDDGCDSNCTFTGCGNGILTSGEECDDGNGADGDGCSAFCVVEFCGDGIVNDVPNEQCDDGNMILLDGCDLACQTETVEVFGRRLLLKDKLFDASKRRIVVQSTDLIIVPPAPGSGGDPTLGGAELRVVNPSTLEEQLIPLPAIHWKALGKPAGSKGYKYRDRSLVSGPCKSAKLRTAQFKVVCRGSGITYSLDEPSQGAVAVTLKLGTDLPYCMSFGGTISKDRPTTGGTVGLFRAYQSSPPPSCPAP